MPGQDGDWLCRLCAAEEEEGEDEAWMVQKEKEGAQDQWHEKHEGWPSGWPWWFGEGVANWEDHDGARRDVDDYSGVKEDEGENDEEEKEEEGDVPFSESLEERMGGPSQVESGAQADDDEVIDDEGAAEANGCVEAVGAPAEEWQVVN